ncbi:hypothetical protein CONLIGDRAFT_686884 [Coniochaeta ligniaria NRRL 30616]|uniref:Uncharacterized protein n=1 Tax=Coniochaeta ligniaria NRRL 30616 TaxID=1408157 RepID=A0A1J7IZR8_9PEZI|nr:hypothetical protein CONLIGDRAFT_686884 [Coniochaeta ligniaria NRRL 30616]
MLFENKGVLGDRPRRLCPIVQAIKGMSFTAPFRIPLAIRRKGWCIPKANLHLLPTSAAAGYAGASLYDSTSDDNEQRQLDLNNVFHSFHSQTHVHSQMISIEALRGGNQIKLGRPTTRAPRIIAPLASDLPIVSETWCIPVSERTTGSASPTRMQCSERGTTTSSGILCERKQKTTITGLSAR